MRSYILWIVACAVLLAGGATTTDLPAVTFEVGEIFPISIDTNFLSQDSITCHLHTPSGQIIQLRPENQGDSEKFTLRPYSLLAGCAVDIKITDSSDQGIWKLTFTPPSATEPEREVQHSVVVSGLDISEVTTEAQTEVQTEPSREIEYLDEKFFNTSLGERLEAIINYFDLVNTESCHIITPKGEEYNLNDLSIAGITVIKHTEVACGVEINVNSEDFVGNWTLFSRDTRYSAPIERRLNFIIHVEEIVQASPEKITVTEGNDFYVRLKNPTDLYDTCKLIKHDDNDITYELDTNHIEECGFIVSGVRINDAGTWEIVYGDKIIYRAQIQVTVNEALAQEDIKLEWSLDRPVDELVGPEDVIYCRATDPTGQVIFEGFGRCHIVLDRARQQHNGVWILNIGNPGRVLTEDVQMTVTVSQFVRPRVFTHVEKERPEVRLACGVEGNHVIRSCKFREPSGRVFLATQGVGEDRYSYHGVEVSLDSSVSTTDCGLRITNPVVEDMGLWRCAIETDDDQVYYGFLTVVCPFVMSQPNPPPIVTEPVLAADLSVVQGVEGEAVTMTCSVPSEIRYCYFRGRMGTVYTVNPGAESDVMEYVGAGFDAGECGIRIRNLQERDSVTWSCHVGFQNTSMPEQSATINVNVQRMLNAEQNPGHADLVVEARVYDNRPVEYCRFVRIDGVGFTSENLPDERYSSRDSLSTGHCSLHIRQPTILDHHPWTVAARIVGQDVEVTDSTDHSLQITPTEPEPESNGHHTETIIYMRTGNMWLLLLLLSITVTLLAFKLAKKENRQWVSQRATSLRNSFRKKQPDAPPEYTANPSNV